ncbi:MAG TPA: endolytic transglycosylase MltG [Gaiellaceae bacterium]|nr:endolytic transglycosylase MltG [Gaiellaceae bacterium]
MEKRALLSAALAALAAGCGGAGSAPPATTAPPPPPKPFRIVFPEGFTRAQMGVRVKVVAKIAERERRRPVRLSEGAYLAASRRGVVPCFGRRPQASLEGFLFPATYDFLRRTPSRRLVAAQLEAFCRNWRRVDLRYARSRNLTPYDVLTIASMIEEEAAVPAERRLVAAVIYNRLHARMPLGIDATLRYGLRIAPTESIRESQLRDPTPYNTRLHFGLPPTPISNPGLAAIEAAAHPARVDYLYYARRRDHRHHFFTASPTAYERFLARNGYGG